MTIASKQPGCSPGELHAVLESGFESGEIALPVLPRVANSVMRMANDPDADIADLSDLIHQDQALAGNVLRIANSAAYCTGEAVVSLRQAVMRLGMATLNEIAVAACLMGEGFRAPGYEAFRRSMLVHAFIAGGFAKELARQKRRNVEAMFLCGLLHSIGRSVVLRLICDTRGHVDEILSEAELHPLIEHFELRAAERVTEVWGLPEIVRATVRHHQDPDSAPAFADESRTTLLASKLATWVVKSIPEQPDAIRDFPEWEPLNYYPDEIDGILACRDILEESASVFTT